MLLLLFTTTDIFHPFSSDFSTTICKSSFLLLPPSKSQKNNTKFRKIKSKICKDIPIPTICKLFPISTVSWEFFYFSFTQQLPFFKIFLVFVQIKHLIVCAIQLDKALIINITSLYLLILYPRFKMVLWDKNLKCSMKEAALRKEPRNLYSFYSLSQYGLFHLKDNFLFHLLFNLF